MVCSAHYLATDPQRTHKGVQLELLQHVSQQQGQVSASRAQDTASSQSAIIHKAGLLCQRCTHCQPCKPGLGPCLGHGPHHVRLVSALVSSTGTSHCELQNTCASPQVQDTLLSPPCILAELKLLPPAQAGQAGAASETSGVGCYI